MLTDKGSMETILFQIAAREGRAFPNALDCLEATILEARREDRESFEALGEAAIQALERMGELPPRTAGEREFRDSL